jgi:hypothetical protein
MVTIFHAIKDYARPGQTFLAGRGLDEHPIMPSATLAVIDDHSSSPEDVIPNTLSCSAGETLVSYGMVYQQISQRVVSVPELRCLWPN